MKKLVNVLGLLMIFYASTSSAQELMSPGYTLLSRVEGARRLLTNVKLERSSKLVTYREYYKETYWRKGKSRTRFRSRIKYKDYVWKEIALALLNMEDGEIRVIKIKKDGQQLVNQDNRFTVNFEPRASGITWNGKNTALAITAKDGSKNIVIGEKWLERPVNGQSREIFYVPHSRGLDQPELIELGDKHLEDDNRAAFLELLTLDVRSLVFPTKNVGEILRPEFPKHIAGAEHTDPDEFYAFLDHKALNPFNRVLVRLAVNGEEEFGGTVSRAKALGLVQFTKDTWNLMMRVFPGAQLPNFEIGAANHRQSIKATILLYNYNLNEMVKALGSQVLTHGDIEFYMAAAHNCGVSRVIKAVRVGGQGHWREILRRYGKTNETTVYLAKYGYLMTHEKAE